MIKPEPSGACNELVKKQKAMAISINCLKLQKHQYLNTSANEMYYNACQITEFIH